MSEIQSHAFLALVSGFLSVLSPCVLPLMPAYLSLISGISVEMGTCDRPAVDRRQAFISARHRWLAGSCDRPAADPPY